VGKKKKGRKRGRDVGQNWGDARGVHRLYFDGACGPTNPGGVATYGWRLMAPDGEELASGTGEACRGPGATNNVAEWHGLWAGLRSLAAKGWRGRLQILGDSQLVLLQLNRLWRCHKERLRQYRDQCLALLEGIEWRAVWIPREQNAEADALSRGGVSRTPPPGQSS
jgi:ribonuclease HI